MKEKLKKKVGSLELGLFLLLGLFDSCLQIGNMVMGVGVPNEGISLGAFEGINTVLLAVVWLMLLGIGIGGFVRSGKWSMAILMIIIGGWVNLLMRIWFGSVWDYIRIPVIGLWINISDMMITMGVVSYIFKR